jgi:hypothetical protein
MSCLSSVTGWITQLRAGVPPRAAVPDRARKQCAFCSGCKQGDAV